jgi:RES domain-containing protein
MMLYRAGTVIARAFGREEPIAKWLEAKTSSAPLVPTVITPGEWNVLLNPLHPQLSRKWIVTGPEPYTFDTRLVPAKRPK